MALTAKFVADFSSFQDAVRKAEVSLKSFETGSNKVKSSLDRMVDKFSGRKLIQDATLMSEAVERIGGTSKFTKEELAQMGNQAKLATDKMRAMGIDIPPQLDNLASKAGGVEKSWRAVGAAIGAAFSLSQLKNAAENVGSAASRIADLSAQAGISTDAVQRLDFVAKQTGSTFDEVSRAVSQMANRLVEGDKSAVGSLQAMGLSVEHLKRLTPDKAFEEIAAAIAKIPDPMQQSKVAMDIFGRAGAELLPTLKADIRALGAEAPIMSQKMIDAGDAFDDSLAKVQGRLDVLKAQALLPVLNLFDAMPSSLQTGAAAFIGLLPTITSITTAFALIVGPGAIGSALATFFATTLPAAFTAILPFLGPVGLIAVGVGAIYAVWRNWETITGFVKGVYDGVKLYLVDKFNAVVDSIKSKVEAVTGFFGTMYDKVVGNSFVPDMVEGIAAEFTKLDGFMVNPARVATDRVAGLFEGLTERLSGLIGGTDSVFGKILSGGLGALFSAGGPLLGLVGAGVSALANVAMKGLSKMWSGIKSIFGGGEEGTKVNPARDSWFGGRDVQTIGNELGAFGVNGDDARQMIERVFNARTQRDFDAASGDIDKILKGNSFAVGTRGIRDFGRGQLAMLHGREEVRTEAQKDAEDSRFDLLARELQGLRNDFRALPRMLAVATVDAVNLR